MHKYNTVFLLVCTSVGLGGLAMISIIISIATDYWLFVMEKLPLKYFVEYDTLEYDYIEEWISNATLSGKIEINTFMGLWRFCTTVEG